jgi:hypothetical protein
MRHLALFTKPGPMALNLDQMMGNHLSTYYNPNLTLTHVQVKQGEPFSKIIKLNTSPLMCYGQFSKSLIKTF